MKEVLLLTILVLTFCSQLFGQANSNCPNLSVATTEKGNSVLFYVSSVGIFDNSKFEYKWIVSNEVKFDGQGTNAISIPIEENLVGQILTATVEIKGLPEGCKNSFSEIGEIYKRPTIIACEPFFNADSSWRDYLSAIQNFNLALQNEKGSKGMITFYFTKLSEKKKAVVMKKKLLKISKIRKVSLDGIEIKIEKGDVYETKFVFIPAESPRPS